MRIATFNINGIKARAEAVAGWLDGATPDIALLQEIKSTDDAFPRSVFEDRGYRIETHGQKGFNGVAIAARMPIEAVTRGLPGDPADVQARYMEAVVGGDRPVRIAVLYLPNGNPAPGPKYDYKLAWMARLEARIRAVLAAEEAAVFAGDYNVIPEDRDAARPAAWVDDALGLPQTRAAFRRITHLGLTDAFRIREPGGRHYSFWDYQAGAWERGNGIRIDHHLLTPQAADLLTRAWIEPDLRAGPKPSDHVPVWIELEP